MQSLAYRNLNFIFVSFFVSFSFHVSQSKIIYNFISNSYCGFMDEVYTFYEAAKLHLTKNELGEKGYGL